ncbi:MAG: alanyl-tRNA editing protein [Acidobacteria bacterium]|nr:alanyl-tRNA editing protein [Acidobacteriota bacterium]
MTHHLYYTDALQTTFDAAVVSSSVVDGKHHIVLDTTAFYPTSGGQPFDTGSLGGHAVLDVVDGDGGVITHVVAGPLEPGQTVTGVVNWARRFDHMQQHTGQHILSAAFERTSGVRTESFHLGSSSCTIDLAREVTPAEIAAAETLACDVVFEDRPVQVRFVSEAEAAALPLRKGPNRTGTLRLIEIDHFDLSACGGTHTPTTGRVGVIAVSGWERFKGGSRIAFVCGHRAVVSYRTLRDVVTGLVRQLTVAPPEIGSAIERLQTDSRANQKVIRQLRIAAAEHEAAQLVVAAEDVGPFRRVLVSSADSDIDVLKTLASAIAAHAGCVAVVIGDGTPVPVVVARAADVAFDAGAWVKQLTAACGGRGGGRPEMAQGGVSGSAAEIVAFARDSVR